MAKDWIGFNDRLYMMVSELETDRGYVDLSLIVRPDMRRFQALDLVLEFNYLSLKELGLTGEPMREKTRDELMALPVVAAQLDEAADQPGVMAQPCENATACVICGRLLWSR